MTACPLRHCGLRCEYLYSQPCHDAAAAAHCCASSTSSRAAQQTSANAFFAVHLELHVREKLDLCESLQRRKTCKACRSCLQWANDNEDFRRRTIHQATQNVVHAMRFALNSRRLFAVLPVRFVCMVLWLDLCAGVFVLVWIRWPLLLCDGVFANECIGNVIVIVRIGFIFSNSSINSVHKSCWSIDYYYWM